MGILSVLPASQSEIITDLIDADQYLSRQKGYGILGLSRKQRLMHAGMLVTVDYLGDSNTIQKAALGGTLSLIAAQQTALCAAIASSAAASSASTSSGT